MTVQAVVGAWRDRVVSRVLAVGSDEGVATAGDQVVFGESALRKRGQRASKAVRVWDLPPGVAGRTGRSVRVWHPPALGGCESGTPLDLVGASLAPPFIGVLRPRTS